MSVEGKAELLRRNWPLAIFSAAFSLTASILVLNGALVGYPLAAFGIFFGTLFFVRNAFPRSSLVSYRVSAEGLSVDGESIAGADILEAKAIPLHGRAIIELTLRTRRVLRLRILGHRVADFAPLLESRRASFRLVASFEKRFIGCSLAFLAFYLWPTSHHGNAFLPQLVIALMSSAMSAMIPAWLIGFVRGRLVVGTDGFATRWLFRERFIPFSQVAAVRPERTRAVVNDIVDTVVELTSGSKLRLRAVDSPNTDAERGIEGRALFGHVASAFERSKHHTSGQPDVRALVERGSRSAREWREGIDALVGSGGARYRVAALSPDSLLAVATDASASTEARVGAAAALVRTNDESLRVRVRVCAEACSDRELREAMLALSEARDDAATETALAALRR